MFNQLDLTDGVLEVRVHGRGGQGGVTCAKLIAALYAELGFYVQTFGDYGSERTGAPIRAFTRVGKSPIKSRNKVYNPKHLLVFDEGLMGPDTVDGAPLGALVLVNSTKGPETLTSLCDHCLLATVDAGAIARKHGIGSSALVIINTTIVGAYAKLAGIPWESVQGAFEHMGLAKDSAPAREAYDSVRFRKPLANASAPTPRPVVRQDVLAITDYATDFPSVLKTGSWRGQTPCYAQNLPPCVLACPAGNDVEGFIRALNNEGIQAAAALLLESQALPSVCGRVCPGFCMEACNRREHDGAVNVRGLERLIGDGASTAPTKAKSANELKISVVGSGPAGLSAAFALAKAGHKVTIHEAGDEPGGLLRWAIPTYRLPLQVLDRDIQRIVSLGVDIKTNNPIDLHKLMELAQSSDAVILAVGQAKPRELSVKGSDLKGVMHGLEFLAKAKSSNPVKLDGDVVVIGGGNTAVDCTRTALRLGANSAAIIYRRGREDMNASDEEIAEALEEGVVIKTCLQPKAVEVAISVERLLVEEVALSKSSPGEKPSMAPTGVMRKIPCGTILLALGQEPDTSILPRDAKIVDGRLIVGDRMTNIWVAGDFSTGSGTVAHAVGDGSRIAKLILGESAKPIEEMEKLEVGPSNMRFDHFDFSPPLKELKIDTSLRLKDFSEVNQGLPSAGEAQRCLSCGRCTNCDTCLVYCPEGIIDRDGSTYRVDETFCKGCGICASECPRMALKMLPLGE